MSEYMGIRAEICGSTKALDAWWGSTVRGSAWADWVGLLADAGTGGAAEVRGTPKAVLANAKKVGAKRPRFDLRIDGGDVSLCAVLSFDDDRDVSAAICIALRGLAAVGAEGDIVVMLSDGARSTHVHLGGNASSCEMAAQPIADKAYGAVFEPSGRRPTGTTSIVSARDAANVGALEIVAASKRADALDVLVGSFERADIRGLVSNALIDLRDARVGAWALPLFEAARDALPDARGILEMGPTPERTRFFALCAILGAQPYAPGYAAVARLYRSVRGEVDRVSGSIAVKRRETWSQFGDAPFVLFERGGQWHCRQKLAPAKEMKFPTGATTEAEARVRVVDARPEAWFAYELATRLLADGGPPEKRSTPLDRAEAKMQVDSVLRRRGL